MVVTLSVVQKMVVFTSGKHNTTSTNSTQSVETGMTSGKGSKVRSSDLCQ